ncbi:MAG TPA: hypothetical protein VGC65_06845 [Bacteroidia bacterium]|jgi:hypothetical protein
MRHTTFRVILFLIPLSFTVACNTCPKAEFRSPQPVAYTVIQKSSYITEKNIAVHIDSLDNTLYFNFTLKQLGNLPFPQNTQYKDTLSKTAFRFDLYHNNKIVSSDYQLLKNTMRWITDSSTTASNICFVSDTINLKQENTIQFQIPMYAFYDLKQGKQTFELAFSQNIFVDEVTIKGKDNSSEFLHISETKPLLNGRIKFEINLPAIYKSVIFGEGLTLRNDSTFSPAGMDNTIWNSSYPDIYWCVFYPKNSFYAQTPYETSTASYIGHDTFNLYHYYKKDSVGFGVYDHDNLSRDDGLGYWYGSLEEISKVKYSKILQFGYINNFQLKVKELGIVN